MMACRVCRSEIPAPAFFSAAPALTSINTQIGIDTAVYLCETCGHAQNPDIPDIAAFYDKDYRISLQGDDHDQIFAVDAAGKPIFRTDHQARLSLGLLNLPEGALVLDYGAAKATTLQRMLAARPDLVPHVFDVSSDYQQAWQGWVEAGHQAVYGIPDHWNGRFDAAMSHFAIEHVADPMDFLRSLRALLNPSGRLLLSLPDVHGNPGDMAVADHLNHFTLPSLQQALTQAGFGVETVDRTSFPGAFFVTAVASPTGTDHGTLPAPEAVADAHRRNAAICAFWEDAHRRMDEAADRMAGEVCAIYGAGFYGTWIGHKIAGRMDIAAFLDQNPGLQGAARLGKPILPPDGLPPHVRHVFAGLNPLKARAIMASVPALKDKDIDIIWLEDQPA